MRPFQIKWHKKARKELRKLGKKIVIQLIKKISSLKENPMKYTFPLAGCDYRKIRTGDYRAILEIIHHKQIVKVLLVGYRKKIYKKFFK